jgi:hypothetical protein
MCLFLLIQRGVCGSLLQASRQIRLHVSSKPNTIQAKYSIHVSSRRISEGGVFYLCADWLAVSPDGHVRGLAGSPGEGVLEIKCPFSKRLYDGIPEYYSDQVQGLMGVLGVAWADFCVWTPTDISIQRVNFDKVRIRLLMPVSAFSRHLPMLSIYLCEPFSWHMLLT